MARKPRRGTKARKTVRPKVIDLKAEEVAVSGVENTPEGDETPDAKAQDEAPNAPEDAVQDAGDPSVEEPQSNDEASDDEAGVEKQQQGAGGSGNLIAAGLAALIVAGGAGAWLYRSYGGQAPDGAVAGQVAELQQQLANARKSNEINAQRVSKLESTVASLKSSAGETAASLEKAGQARALKLQAKLDELSAAMASAAKAGDGGSAGQAANALKIEELSRSAAAAIDRLSKIETKLESATGADAAVVEQLKGQIASLTEALEAVKAQQAARSSRTVSALGQSFGRLTSAVAAGSPFSAELDALVSVAPTLPGIALLRDVAGAGVPSLGALADELEGLAVGVEAKKTEAAASKTEQGGVFSVITSQLSKVVKIRKIGEVNWADTLRQSAGTVRAGKLNAVVVALSEIADGAPDGLSAWQERAKARLAVDGAMQELSNAVLRQLAATGEAG